MGHPISGEHENHSAQCRSGTGNCVMSHRFVSLDVVDNLREWNVAEDPFDLGAVTVRVREQKLANIAVIPREKGMPTIYVDTEEVRSRLRLPKMDKVCVDDGHSDRHSSTWSYQNQRVSRSVWTLCVQFYSHVAHFGRQMTLSVRTGYTSPRQEHVVLPISPARPEARVQSGVSGRSRPRGPIAGIRASPAS